MNKKLPIYILIAYFIFVIIILIVQLTNKEKNDFVAVRLDEKLENAVVVYEKSPVMLKKQVQTFINEENTSETPVFIDGNAYLSMEFYKNGFDAVTSYSKSKNRETLKLDNLALVMKPDETQAKLYSAEREKNVKLENPPIFIGDELYLSVRDFGDIFKFEIFYDEGLIILSHMKDIFDVEKEADSVEEVKEMVYNLPIAGAKLKSFGNKGDKEELPPETEEKQGFRTMASDGDCLYYVKNGRLIKTENLSSEVCSVALPSGFEDEKISLLGGCVCVTGSNGGRAALGIYDMSGSEVILKRYVLTDGEAIGLVYDKGRFFFGALAEFDENSGKGEKEGSYIPVNWGNVRYFPEKSGDKLLNIISVDGKKPEEGENVLSIYGADENATCFCGSGIYTAQIDKNLIYGDKDTTHTNIYRFGFSENGAVFAGKIRLEGEKAVGAADMPAFIVYDENGSASYYLVDSRLSVNCRRDGFKLEGDRILSGGDRLFMTGSGKTYVLDLYSGEIFGEFNIGDDRYELYDGERIIGFDRLIQEGVTYPSLKITMYDISDPNDIRVLSEDIIENTSEESVNNLIPVIGGDIVILPLQVYNGDIFESREYIYTVNSIYGLNPENK